jgi:hypothetical protein
MRAKLVLISSLSALLLNCSGVNSLSTKHVQCEIAKDYIKHFVIDAKRFRSEQSKEGAPEFIGVNLAPYALLPQLSANGLVEGNTPEFLPDVENWPDISKLSDESVLDSCAGLRSWLSEQEVLFAEEEIRPLLQDETWQIHLLSIAMPVLTDDLNSAVVFASKGRGGMSGVGVLAIYAKGPDENWRLVSEHVRWVT